MDTYKSYETDFESSEGTEDWLIGSNGSFADGQLKIENWGGVSHTIYDGDVYSGDLTFSADVSGWGTAEANTIKLLFYYRDENNYYAVEGAGSGGVTLKKRVDGAEQTLGNYGGYTVKEGARLTVSYENGVITVTGSKGEIDTILFDAVSDASLTSGRVGTGIAYNVAFFDNVSVEAVLTDAYPPSAPSELRATSVGSETVDLAWDASEDNVGIEGYELKVNGVSRGWTEETSYHLDGLEGGTSYSITVVARDLSGNRSSSSDALTIVTQPSTKLSREGWSGSASSTEPGGTPASALDGVNSTRWSSGQAMTAGGWYVIDMGAKQSFNRIVFDSGASSGDYMRGYQIEVSGDGVVWSSAIAEGAGSVLTDARFETVSARFVRIKQTGESGSWWSIHEIYAHLVPESGGEDTGGEDTGGEDTDGEGTEGLASTYSYKLTKEDIATADGIIDIALKTGQTGVEIPQELLSGIRGKSIAVNAGGLRVTLPNEMLRNALKQAADAHASLVFQMHLVEDINQIVPNWKNGDVEFAGDAYDLFLKLRTADGEVTRIESFDQPVELRFRIEEAKGKAAPVVYYIKDDGTLQYIPTRHNNGEVMAEVDHFSLYAPLVFVPGSNDGPLRNHWAYHALVRVAGLFLDHVQRLSMSPLENPGEPMDRGAFAAYVARSLGMPKNYGETLFADAAEQAYSEEIQSLAAAKVVHGVGEQRFAPERPITRQEAIVMLTRAIHAVSQDVGTAPAQQQLPFLDVQELDDWAYADMESAWRLGLLRGKPGSILDPHAVLSRAEAAELVYRASLLMHK